MFLVVKFYGISSNGFISTSPLGLKDEDTMNINGYMHIMPITSMMIVTTHFVILFFLYTYLASHQ